MYSRLGMAKPGVFSNEDAFGSHGAHKEFLLEHIGSCWRRMLTYGARQ